MAKRARLFEDVPKSTVPYALLVVVGVLQASSVVLSQLSLKSNSVGVYQLAKLTQGPLVATIEYFWLRKTLSHKRVLLLAAITVSVGLATVGDLEMSVVGVTFALAAVCATSVESVIFGYLHKAYNLVTLQVLDITLVFSSLYMFISTLVFEYGAGNIILHWVNTLYLRGAHAPPPPHFGIFDEAQATHLNVYGVAKERLNYLLHLSPLGCSLVAMSTVLAGLVNWSSVSINGTFGPVTYALLALFKTVSIVVMGIVFFDKGATSKGAFGSFMSLVLMAAYSRVSLVENRRQKAAASAEESKSLLPTEDETDQAKAKQ